MNIHSYCLESSYSQAIEGFPELEIAQFKPIVGHQHDALHVLLTSSKKDLISNASKYILQNNPVKSILTIDSVNMKALFHTEIKVSLTRIAQQYNIKIKVNSSSLSSNPKICLLGSIDAIESARIRVLVMLDQLSGLHVEKLDQIPYYLHNLIAGRKHVQLQSIMEETSTNIYLQSPFSHVCTEKEMQQGIVYLTGESMPGLNRARDLLVKLSAQKLKSLYHKDSTMDTRKIDWILLYKRSQLRKIMIDNGSFFSFPALGAGSNFVSIYAENRVNVERSIRLLNYLISTLYEASFDLTGSLKNIDLSACLSQISQETNAYVTFDAENHKISLFGIEKQVKSAYQSLAELHFFKEKHTFATFCLELATDQLEFISGKKNGKINKIMKTCTVNIRFKATNEYNSCIIVESSNHANAFEGLTLLQDELPAETSFYVPEIYHRRIIGVAGKNIQKVMKKYGVYVKFSGAEEFSSLGGYFENEDNVVARTPMKNQINLENLKQTVTEFIGFQRDRDFVSTWVNVPYAMQRTILHQFGSQLREMCRTNNAKMWWPERLGTNQVVIYGPQTQLPTIASFLSSVVKMEEHVVIAHTNDLEAFLLDKSSGKIRKNIAKVTSSVSLEDIAILDQFNHRDEWLEFAWIKDTKDKIIVLRLSYCPSSKEDLKKAKEAIQDMIESKHLPFTEPVFTDKPCTQTKESNQSPKDAVVKKDASTCLSSADMEPIHHPLDMPVMKSFSVASNSLLSAPFPSGKNIWSSPETQPNNMILPTIHMRPIELYHSFSIPHQQHMFSHTMGPLFQQSEQPKRTRSSVPTIGTKHHSQQQHHHNSWPDIFSGSRDLFDTLPSRRASSANATQYAFEHYPNTSTSLSFHQQNNSKLDQTKAIIYRVY
ncbi:uncharacterized protein B0P05DRAFT_538748 [Gilbertella persicaria]|uniref:uncharacterized protein n=1 Tax=Gilbertella persicaria TaxID=101096 RepID=UPI0022208C4C|nr:uncharacterized protein B0P05DRAFT_538748 [Gilbertella persicaria]KAI8081949.1 hypothetical protein B0P05DRAFT_538748 [Gilbertella persicaria]